MSETTQMQLGVKFQLLKTDLMAMYEKGDKGNTFLLAPTNVEKSNQVTLQQMLDDFKAAFDDNSEIIQDNLESIPTKGNQKMNLNELAFSLKTAYIYVEGDVKEYAFAIEVDLGNAIPDLRFVKIEKLSFAIWNTKKNQVLKTMNLDSIENLVKLLE